MLPRRLAMLPSRLLVRASSLLSTFPSPLLPSALFDSFVAPPKHNDEEPLTLGSVVLAAEQVVKVPQSPQRPAAGWQLDVDALPALPFLAPLKSLGGLSLAAYLITEARSGFLAVRQAPKQVWADISVDLKMASNELSVVKTRLGQARVEIETQRERIQDLEELCNELSVFIEMKKDEISALKRGRVQ